MNSCCLNYYIIPDDENLKPKTLQLNSSGCNSCGCQCGYIQYESLAPDIPKLTNNDTKDEDHIVTEARLRRQIVEISRLFDAATKVKPGHYSKAHYEIIKLNGNGTNYLSIPNFVEGSLELYSSDGYLINPDTYSYRDGYLVITGCTSHSSKCGCSDSCGMYKNSRSHVGWNGIFQAKARFGNECADEAVKLAIRSYLFEYNAYGNIIEADWKGLPVVRGFREPHAWTTLVKRYLEEKQLENYFAFA